MLQRKQAYMIGVRAALREHAKLKTELTRQVDIFSIIEAASVPLMFRPLIGLSGAYFPPKIAGKSVPGILINSNHQRSRQRYTAAHEYCHHLRDHMLIFDVETEVSPSRWLRLDDRERIAEAFASWFLMPPTLVETTLKALEVSLAQLTPEAAYSLALHLGTSYRATVSHLYYMKRISEAARNQLQKYQPKNIKDRLIREAARLTTWNDVWVLGKAYSGKVIYPSEGDELNLVLPEIPSSGYVWELTVTPGEGALSLVESRFEQARGHLQIGGEGVRCLHFVVNAPGQYDLALEKKRPWSDAKAIDTFAVTLDVESKRLGIREELLTYV